MRDYNIYDFGIYFDDMLFDHYVRHPDPTRVGEYVIDIGGIKVGFGPKYMLKKIIKTLIPRIYPSGHIPENQIITRPIPRVDAPVIRRLGASEAVDVDKIISLRGEEDSKKTTFLTEMDDKQRDESLKHDIDLGVNTASIIL